MFARSGAFSESKIVHFVTYTYTLKAHVVFASMVGGPEAGLLRKARDAHLDALGATASDRLRWTRDGLLMRMNFGVRCAYAHGVSAIRTHLDSVPAQAERSWGAFREVRAEWAGKVALQAVSLVPIDL